ncbi:DUF7691 family protein [Streptomyces sp. CS62]|uniref:DUF7691 family protein n=1 Tax=Streptomyces sp. CS62 TaxID=3119268 RepID=UPI002F927723
MGHLEMSTGDMRDVIRLLTAVERTPEQDRVLGSARERCARADARFEAEGVRLDVPVAQALEELLEGAPSADEGPGYTYAFQALVAVLFSDTCDLGHWNPAVLVPHRGRRDDPPRGPRGPGAGLAPVRRPAAAPAASR